MNPENKNLRQQTDLLMSLREQIRTLDVEIMNEEASLGDWKRVPRRGNGWVSCLAVSLSVVKRAQLSPHSAAPLSDMCPPKRHSQVSLGPTTPVTPKVEPLVVEAERELHKISFIGEVGDGFSNRPRVPYR
jgi:hypothetical protein